MSLTVGPVTDTSLVGTYSLKIGAAISDSTNPVYSYASFTVNVYGPAVNKGPPYYSSALTNVVIDVGKSQTYQFPPIKDPD